MKEYQLTTIKDIFEKIPSDRIDTLMAELTIVVKRAQSINGIMQTISKNVVGKEGRSIFPDTITWKDDGNGSIKINILVNDTPIMTVEETIKDKD